MYVVHIMRMATDDAHMAPQKFVVVSSRKASTASSLSGVLDSSDEIAIVR